MVGETSVRKPALLMPCARQDRAKAAFNRWAAMGYDVFFYQDQGTTEFVAEAAATVIGEWRGVWHATNVLAHNAYHKGYEVMLFAGDDMDPDPAHKGGQIAKEYIDQFPDGFGVMQPIGDMQGKDRAGKQAAARICGSPWFGRAWVEHAYNGNGPTNARYGHFFADEELYHYAIKYHALWQRPDLIQDHHHWSFGRMKRQAYHDVAQKNWNRDKALFKARMGYGFP